MLEADHLTVSGDVTFGKDVSLKVSVQSLKLSIYLIFRVLLSLLPTMETESIFHLVPFWRIRLSLATCVFSITSHRNLTTNPKSQWDPNPIHRLSVSYKNPSSILATRVIRVFSLFQTEFHSHQRGPSNSEAQFTLRAYSKPWHSDTQTTQKD